jgi:hypothetical protein
MRRLPRAATSPSTSPLALDHVFPFYDFDTTDHDDAEVQSVNRQRKLAMCECTLSRINRVLPLIREHWPGATPIQIYVAFTLSLGDVDELLLSIGDAAFLASVDAEIARLRAARPAAPARAAAPDSDSDSDADPDDAAPRRAARPAPPCPAGVDAAAWAAWSDIHRRSYLSGATRQNAYLYRNLPAGERQRNGPWSAGETRAFLARRAEMRPAWAGRGPQWGVFSQAIPGRVGYQCANFYRALIAAGELADPDYAVGGDGKLHYTRRRARDAPPASFYERKARKNPLRGQLDFITKTEIRVPAMSPDGYVLDYNTWMSLVVQPNPQDPFTRRRINKRSLVVLTTKNFDRYRDQIKNLPDAALSA